GVLRVRVAPAGHPAVPLLAAGVVRAEHALPAVLLAHRHRHVVAGGALLLPAVSALAALGGEAGGGTLLVLLVGIGVLVAVDVDQFEAPEVDRIRRRAPDRAE